MAALVEGEVHPFLVDVDAPGVAVVAAQSLDLVRRFADGVVRQRRADPPDAVLGEVGGAAVTDRASLRDRRRPPVRCPWRGLPTTCSPSHLRTRSTGIRSAAPGVVSSAQASLRRYEDVDRGLPRHVGRRGTIRWTAVPKKPSNSSSVAKSYIGDKAPAILQDCVQLHGGIGVTWDHDLHLYIRRVELVLLFVRHSLSIIGSASHKGLGLEENHGH